VTLYTLKAYGIQEVKLGRHTLAFSHFAWKTFCVHAGKYEMGLKAAVGESGLV